MAAYALNASTRRHSRRVTRYVLPLVGRTDELAQLEADREATAAGRGKIVGVSAEAGMGKSRLIAEFVRSSRRRGLSVAMGECQSFGTGTSYFVWREIWRTLLGVKEDATPDVQAQQLEDALRAVDPDLVARAPLLDAMFGLSIPDNDLTRSFDAKLRKTSLENLLADYLRKRAQTEPQVLVLEDCHWLDPLSRDLVDVVARVVASRVLRAASSSLVYRPEAALPQGLGLAQLPQIEELPLAALDEAHMTELARAKLVQLFEDETDSTQLLVELVVGRAQGNPFYVEELLNYVHAQEIDPADERALRSLELPGSLHSLVLSRIDTLSESPRRTLKVASVVGRVFRAPMLPGVYPELGTIGDVRAHLATLRLLDLVNPDREEDESYLFRHAVTQEVAYESIPYALRIDLHGHVGRFIEHDEPDAIDRNIDLLAHHFWLSDDEERKRAYLRRAGEAAQAAYANASAIDYFERLAPLLPETERAAVLLKLGKVLELVGDWARAEAIEREALALAEDAGDEDAEAWCQAALAEVMRKTGRYEEATAALAAAATLFERVDNEEGLGQVLHLAGTIAAQRGDYPAARESYEQSLGIRERLGDISSMGSLLSNLGVVGEYDGDYDASRDFHERSLALRRELGDRWAIAVSLTNLGMIAVLQERHEEARAHFEEAMRLNREVGDTWMVAISHNNLGNAYRGLGDLEAASRGYSESLQAYRAYGDKWAIAFLLEDIAALAALADEHEQALALVGAADRMREEIGSPRGPALEAELDRRLQAAHEALGDAAARAIRAGGAGLGLEEALDAAQAFCEEPSAND